MADIGEVNVHFLHTSSFAPENPEIGEVFRGKSGKNRGLQKNVGIGTGSI
jgi:hypothetical protein